MKTVLLLFALVVGSSSVWADTTYKLTQVTSVSAGNKYVFVRNSHALSNSVSSKKLQTIDSYSTTGLTGSETYVWALESATGGFYLKNVSLNSNQYLNNTSGTDMSFASKNSSSIWSIAFTNGVATITNNSNSNRYIGETSSGSNEYKAYSQSGNGKDFTVYVLEEENGGDQTPSISADNVNIAFDATGGSITYTLKNATGNVSASVTSGDWLTLGTITASEVPFTCSANTGAERTATITLSFSGATDKAVTITQNGAQYTVTIETPTNGTLSVKLKSDNSVVTSGSQHAAGTVLIITATPDEGYNFKNIQVVDPTTHTFTNSNIREYTLLAANTTIKANFEAKVYHNVNWYVNGTISSTVPVEEGTAIAKPATNPISIVGKRFVGWTAAAINGTTNTAPTFFTAANMGTEDVNYYAVFATVETEGPDTYAKITSSTLDTNETYVLGAEQASNNNTMWYFYDYDNVDKNTSWGKSTSTPATVSPLKLTLSGTASSLIVQDENGKYLVPWSGNFRMESASTNATISINASGVLSGTSASTTTNPPTVNLRYNHNNGSGGFRWYDGSTGTQAYLYKVVPGTTYSNYRTTVPTTATITLNDACTDGTLVYGTYSNSQAFVVSDDIEVSEVSVVDGKLFVDSYSTGDVVPANTGVLVAALAGGNYDVTLSAEAGTSVLGNDNMLKPSGDAGITAENMNVDNTKFYRLTMHNYTQLGFWWGAENGAAFALAANKAYLAVPTTNSVREGLWIDDDATGVRQIENGELRMENSFYNLAGQRVAQPTKGLYIVNGRKVVVK